MLDAQGLELSPYCSRCDKNVAPSPTKNWLQAIYGWAAATGRRTTGYDAPDSATCTIAQDFLA